MRKLAVILISFISISIYCQTPITQPYWFQKYIQFSNQSTFPTVTRFTLLVRHDSLFYNNGIGSGWINLGSIVLTNGSGTTANGTTLDLGGTTNIPTYLDPQYTASSIFELGSNKPYGNIILSAENTSLTGIDSTLSIANSIQVNKRFSTIQAGQDSATLVFEIASGRQGGITGKNDSLFLFDNLGNYISLADLITGTHLPIIGENQTNSIKLSTSTTHNNTGLIDLYTDDSSKPGMVISANSVNSIGEKIITNHSSSIGAYIQNDLGTGLYIPNNSTHRAILIPNNSGTGIELDNVAGAIPLLIDSASFDILKVADNGDIFIHKDLADTVATLADIRAGSSGGTVRSVSTNSPITGGTITTTGTIGIDTAKSQGKIATFGDVNLKAPKASPTFTGTVTIPTPFTLGATSVTTTGTQLNYLNGATGTTGTISTNLVYSTSPTLVTPVLGVASGTSLSLTGTGGNGYVNFPTQSSDPSTPVSGFNLFAESASKFAFKGTNGFKRIFDGTANTADQTYTLPNFSGTFILNTDNTSQSIGLTSGFGSNLTLNQGFGTDMFTSFATGNWTLTSGWDATNGGSGGININHNANGTTTATLNTVAASVGTTYKITIVVSALSAGTCTYSFGGVTGQTLSAASTYTDYLTATTTGGLIFTPSNTSRFTINSISIKPISNGIQTITGENGGAKINGLQLYNNTVSTSSTLKQNSPQLEFYGHYWNTSTGANVTGKYRIGTDNTSGTNATGLSQFNLISESFNGSAYSNILYFTHNASGTSTLVWTGNGGIQSALNSSSAFNTSGDISGYLVKGTTSGVNSVMGGGYFWQDGTGTVLASIKSYGAAFGTAALQKFLEIKNVQAGALTLWTNNLERIRVQSDGNTDFLGTNGIRLGGTGANDHNSIIYSPSSNLLTVLPRVDAAKIFTIGNAANTDILAVNSSTPGVTITGTVGVSGHTTIEGVTSTGATGSGKFVFDNSPVLITPTLGVASATSLDVSAKGHIDTAGFYYGKIAITTSQFDKTNDSALQDIPGLKMYLTAGNTYKFNSQLFITGEATVTDAYSMHFTGTRNYIIFKISHMIPSDGVEIVQTTDLKSPLVNWGTTYENFIEGTIKATTSGWLSVRFAQNLPVSGKTISVLVGSTFEVKRVN